jgi:hypothetical protein
MEAVPCFVSYGTYHVSYGTYQCIR